MRSTKDNGNGPDYRILASVMEIGAAWKRETAAKREYLSVKINDPSFPASVNARLIGSDDDSMNLYWTRPSEEWQLPERAPPAGLSRLCDLLEHAQPHRPRCGNAE